MIRLYDETKDFFNGQKILSANKDNDSIVLTFELGKIIITHEQDWCENVVIVDEPYYSNLVGSTLVEIEQRTNVTSTEDGIEGITFIYLHTSNGIETVRFFGESNGYYSVAGNILCYVKEGLLFSNEIRNEDIFI